jgi:hypothetical protein
MSYYPIVRISMHVARFKAGKGDSVTPSQESRGCEISKRIDFGFLLPYSIIRERYEDVSR